jgi:DNA-binding response OmpR family regulator
MKEKIVLLVDADGDSEGFVLEAAARTGRGVLMAKTSRDAFKVIRDELHRLDLVIVDVDPGAHGLALLEAISGCADTPAMIVITALEESYMKPISQEHGAAACLGKPIAIAKLKSTLDEVSASWALTSDRWGSLVPRPTEKTSRVKARFRGIAAKLSSSGTARRKNS